MVPTLCGLPPPPPPYDDFKIPPQPICSSKSHKYDNYKTIYKAQSSPLLLVPLGKPVHQAIHYPTANFGPLSRGRFPNPMLITVFDTYLNPICETFSPSFTIIRPHVKQSPRKFAPPWKAFLREKSPPLLFWGGDIILYLQIFYHCFSFISNFYGTNYGLSK